METSVEELSPVTKKVKVVISDEEVRKEMDTAFEKIKKDLVIPGFRRGKVPKHIAEMRIGKALRKEATETIAVNVMKEVLSEHNISPVADPVMSKVETEEDSPVAYEALIEVLPDFDVAEYRGIKIPAEEPEPVTEEDVEKELDFVRRRNARYVPVERTAAEEDDVVNIDYTQEIEGGVETYDNRTVRLDRNNILPDFIENIIGMSVGEKKEFDLVVPEENPIEKMAGKTVKFNVELKEIKIEQLPELNDDLAKEVSDCKTIKEFRNKIKDTLEDHRKREAVSGERVKILEELVQRTGIELPKSLLNSQTRRNILRDIERDLYSGVPKKTIDENRDQIFQKASEKSVQQIKASLILERIAEKEGITVTDEEIEQKIEEQARRKGITKEKLKESFKKENYLDELRQELLNIKVFNLLHEYAVREPQKKKEK